MAPAKRPRGRPRKNVENPQTTKKSSASSGELRQTRKRKRDSTNGVSFAAKRVKEEESTDEKIVVAGPRISSLEATYSKPIFKVSGLNLLPAEKLPEFMRPLFATSSSASLGQDDILGNVYDASSTSPTTVAAPLTGANGELTGETPVEPELTQQEVLHKEGNLPNPTQQVTPLSQSSLQKIRHRQETSEQPSLSKSVRTESLRADSRDEEDSEQDDAQFQVLQQLQRDLSRDGTPRQVLNRCPVCQLILENANIDDFRDHVESCLEEGQSNSPTPAVEHRLEEAAQTGTQDLVLDSDLPPPFALPLNTASDEEDEDELEAGYITTQENTARKIARKQFRPLTDPEMFLMALADPQKRSTAALFAVAANAQNALKLWQDEWIALEKKTARFTQPPHRPHDPRKPEEPVVYEDKKEAGLYGYKYDPDPKKRGLQEPDKQKYGRFVGGRELRKLNAASKAKGLKANDADTIVEGPRLRRQRQVFDGISEADDRRRGTRTASEAFSGADNGRKRPLDDGVEGQPRKRGRPRTNPLPPRIREMRAESQLGTGVTSEAEGGFGSNESTPAPTAPIAKRRGRPPKNANAAKLPASATTKAPKATTKAMKARIKSEKRSKSMKRWWGIRKAAAERAALLAGDVSGVLSGAAAELEKDDLENGDLEEEDSERTEESAEPSDAEEGTDGGTGAATPVSGPSLVPTAAKACKPGRKGTLITLKVPSRPSRGATPDDTSASTPAPPEDAPVPGKLLGTERVLLPKAAVTEYEQYQQLSTPGSEENLGKRKRKLTGIAAAAAAGSGGERGISELQNKMKRKAERGGDYGDLGDESKSPSLGPPTSTEVEDDDDGDEWKGD
ncbi:MAG: hypothetical protein M1819_004033 [Sarea resinae]|nr:MAG: hypothetical protein M1819_004033 [Sarea resinae]